MASPVHHTAKIAQLSRGITALFNFRSPAQLLVSGAVFRSSFIVFPACQAASSNDEISCPGTRV